MNTPHPTTARPRIYSIRLQGQLNDDFVASYCPPAVTLSIEGEDSLLNDICTDQSGLIGLIRKLHNLGLTIKDIHSDAM